MYATEEKVKMEKMINGGFSTMQGITISDFKWFGLDKFTEKIVSENLADFTYILDFDDDSEAHREVVKTCREKFSHGSQYIADLAYDEKPSDSIDYDLVGSFFCEKIEQTFVDLYVKMTRNVAKKFSCKEDLHEYIVKSLISLNGATAERYITRGDVVIFEAY